VLTVSHDEINNTFRIIKALHLLQWSTMCIDS